MDGRIAANDLNRAALMRARVHPSLTGLDGTGVVICVIDYGFDLLHPALRTASGETRFALLIDQNGCRLNRAEINGLIRACECSVDRSAMDDVYDPHAHYFGREGVQVGAHGSWVASIAAGSDTGNFTGVAPNAVLVGVQLDLPDTAWREEDGDGQPSWRDAAARGADSLRHWDGWRSYEDSGAIVRAIEDGFEAAQSLKPDGVVMNLSIGAWAGGHDEGGAVQQALARVVEAGRDRANAVTVIVTGTGNSGADAGHFQGHMTGDEPARFNWLFESDAGAVAKLEIWSDCPSETAVDVRLRSVVGDAICTLDGSPMGTTEIRLDDGAIVGIAENRGLVRGNLRAVRLAIDASLLTRSQSTKGEYQLDITVRPIGSGLSYSGRHSTVHAWIERDCAHGPMTKLKPSMREASLTSFACAPNIISVAGLDNKAANDAVLAMSGRGPRPWTEAEETAAPVLAAPANGLFGARSKTNQYMRGSGTSGAAAIVSGAAALAMQAADLAGHRLTRGNLVRTLLGRTVDFDSLDNWQPDLGYGPLRFDASAVLHNPQAPKETARRMKEPRDERAISPAN